MPRGAAYIHGLPAAGNFGLLAIIAAKLQQKRERVPWSRPKIDG